ncbi:hypothetical protein AOLI_G00318140 [Acnodon oligacanthus]
MRRLRGSEPGSQALGSGTGSSATPSASRRRNDPRARLHEERERARGVKSVGITSAQELRLHVPPSEVAKLPSFLVQCAWLFREDGRAKSHGGKTLSSPAFHALSGLA